MPWILETYNKKYEFDTKIDAIKYADDTLVNESDRDKWHISKIGEDFIVYEYVLGIMLVERFIIKYII